MPASTIAPERVIEWITRNPARMLGLDDRIGTLEPGKVADVVVWSGDPFSIYSHADRVYVDGALAYDRKDPCAPADVGLRTRPAEPGAPP